MQAGRTSMVAWWLGVVVAACAALIAACERPAAAPGAGRLRVVATTGMLGDAVRAIGGGRVEITTLMGPGVDPHLYKASPGDVRDIGQADVLVVNGLHLEGRLAEAIERAGAGRPVLAVAEALPRERLRQAPDAPGQPDPHVWFDVSLWHDAMPGIATTLAAADPAGAPAYRAACAEYQERLAALHDYARSVLATIPPERRVLVTAHDAFGYMGRAYGLEVLAIQGLSTDSEASLRDINALVDTLVVRGIPAVFVESSVPPKTVQALIEGCRARGHRVELGGELHGDALGSPGTPAGDYVGMVVHNVETIARALGGTVPVDRPVFPDARPPLATAPEGGS
jgi:manganese/zinc/iron transport system substrate-binding protein